MNRNRNTAQRESLRRDRNRERGFRVWQGGCKTTSPVQVFRVEAPLEAVRCSPEWGEPYIRVYHPNRAPRVNTTEDRYRLPLFAPHARSSDILHPSNYDPIGTCDESGECHDSIWGRYQFVLRRRLTPNRHHQMRSDGIGLEMTTIVMPSCSSDRDNALNRSGPSQLLHNHLAGLQGKKCWWPVCGSSSLLCQPHSMSLERQVSSWQYSRRDDYQVLLHSTNISYQSQCSVPFQLMPCQKMRSEQVIIVRPCRGMSIRWPDSRYWILGVELHTHDRY